MLTPWLLFTPRRAPERTTARHKLAFPFMYAKSSTGKQNHRQGYFPPPRAGQNPGRTRVGKVPTDTQGPWGSRDSSAEDLQHLAAKDPATSQGVQSSSSSRDTLLPIQSSGHKSTEEGSHTEGKIYHGFSCLPLA